LWAWIVPPAQINQAELILGAVIRKSEMFNRFPLSAEDANLVRTGILAKGVFLTVVSPQVLPPMGQLH